MTRQALKEHFVLDKIATQEKIEVTPHDKDVEIAYMAMQRGESPRKVRARLDITGAGNGPSPVGVSVTSAR